MQAAKVISTGYQPREWQHNVHRNLKRFNVLVIHRRGGKTVLAVNSLIDAALRHQGKDGRFAYVAPFLKQAKQIAWDYVKQYLRPIPGVKFNEAELKAELPNGSRIMLFGADNPDAMRGLYLDGIVLDEIADMRTEFWPEVIRPALSDRRGWAIFIGTPKGMNLFYELYNGATHGFPQKGGGVVKDPDWWSCLLNVYETNALDPAEIESNRVTQSDSAFRREFLCDFTASTDNVLITLDRVEAAMQRDMVEGHVRDMPRVIGVDVARFGDDKTVFQRRQGLFAHEPIVIEGMDNMQVTGRLVTLVNEYKPDAVFVDAGRGEGVIDRMRQLGHDVVEVNFGARAPDPQRFVNWRSHMWWAMNEWLEAGGRLPRDPRLRTDLTAVTYDYDAANRLRLIPKEKLKEQGLPSPDTADALALTFAFPVALKPRSGYANTAQSRVVTDYDPFKI